jgi:cellulase (glycosyl hydrolase family 5)
MLLAIFFCTGVKAQAGRWKEKKSQQWYKKQGWLVGANFIASDAVNQLEMWQVDSFNPPLIDQELGYAESIGMNCMRVFLHHSAWVQDPKGFKERINRYLAIANRHHMTTIFVFFDDCWNDTYHKGKQPLSRPGIHNSGWLQDPGKAYGENSGLPDTLEAYVKDILARFKKDKRILLWDLYNEPGNNGRFEQSLDLLKKVFAWAREVNPNQPLTTGLWNDAGQLDGINAFILANDDVITYHNYDDSTHHHLVINQLKIYKRPLVCTEYMARKRKSTFLTILPLLKSQHIGAINWGLVSGKTNTKYAWDEPLPDGSEPKLWFHDIFRPDGTPYDANETDFIKSLTQPFIY